MNKEYDYTELNKIIRRLVPSIMELKKGCLVEVINEGINTGLRLRLLSNNQATVESVCEDYNTCEIPIFYKTPLNSIWRWKTYGINDVSKMVYNIDDVGDTGFNIIGREIEFSDIFEALQINLKNHPSANIKSMLFLKKSATAEIDGWNFKRLFHEQAFNTLYSISEILCPETTSGN